MRRMIQVGAGLLLMVAIANPAYAQTNAYTEGNGIQDSPHDFSDGLRVAGVATATANTEGTWNSAQVICEVCHTPHNALIAVPLWDHTVTGATFTPYDSPTIDANSGTIPAPAGISLLCLSCHDGVTNIDAFGGGAGTLTIGASGEYGGPGTSVDFGIDLQDDHPISMTFDAALGGTTGLDTELYDPTTQSSGLGSTIADDMLFGPSSDQVECASCHDVHNKATTPGYLLLKTNAQSALCLTCHNK